MAFLRPEVRALARRWREALVGGAVALLGLWLTLGPGYLLAVPGVALLLGGAALVLLGIQRGRFRGPSGGVGAVQVDEGQIAYFGPLTGGMVALRDMERLSLEREMFPAHWKLEQPGQPAVLIPVNAEGSEALFDAFATLPGLQTERMLAELRASRRAPVVIWQRPGAAPRGITLH